jgi:prephenate dehydratase
MKVAYQGAPGAFGHQACLAFLPEYDPVAQPSFAAVIAAVEQGLAECGMLPVENNVAGPVPEAVALLGASSAVEVGRHVLPVRMHLLGLPGASLAGMRVAISHPVALRQCARTLAALGLATEEAENTAVAARALDRLDKAALASEAAAAAYGLAILRRDVHDSPDNATTFVVLARGER